MYGRSTPGDPSDGPWYVYSTFTFAFYSRRRKELEWRHQDIYETTSLPLTPFLDVVSLALACFYQWNTDKLQGKTEIKPIRYTTAGYAAGITCYRASLYIPQHAASTGD